MNKLKRIFFTIADRNNLSYYNKLEKSFAKFHPEEELILYDEDKIRAFNDQKFFYRATPLITSKLMNEGHETVVKFDCDQIITGNLSHVWEGEFDAGVVFNSNPREMKVYPVTIWDVPHLDYVNCGFVVMKSKEFVEHWKQLCLSSHFENYQMREQDLLNILVYYGNYNIKFLDKSDKWHGLISKGYWPNIELSGEDLILRKNEEWPTGEDKKIVCLHWAGGYTPNKMNDMGIRFKPLVAERLKWLTR